MKAYLIPWPLGREKEEKLYFETTHRVCPPEETFERLRPLRELAGITRLADITHLDCLGIPTYMAVRPLVDHYTENISVYNGKGLTKIQAKVSALMEAVERYGGERHGRPVLLADRSEIEKYGPSVDPASLILPQGQTLEPWERLDWVCGTDLLSGETVFVPAAAVFCPYRPDNGARFIPCFSNTNGLASGNTLGEALSQALAEVIERDAESMAEISGEATTIDLKTFDSPLIQELIEKFEKAGINLLVKETSSEFGAPSFFAASDDPNTENPILLCRGSGTHLNAEIAVIRAVTETAQSRCTIISGSREDLTEEEDKKNENYHELRRRMAYWFEATPPLKSFRDIRSVQNMNFCDDLETMLRPFKKAPFGRVIAVDLTPPSVGVPVVRVIVPGLEQTSVHAERIGPRALAKMRSVSGRGLSRPKGSRN